MGKLFEELAALKKAYDEKLASSGEAAVKEAFKEVFDKHPRLKSIVWTQFTKYFNDGDPCYFNVYDFDFHVSDVQNEDYYAECSSEKDYHYGESSYILEQYAQDDEEAMKIMESVHNLSRELPEDVLESIFGDHCKIVATPKGFDVQEFEHD